MSSRAVKAALALATVLALATGCEQQRAQQEVLLETRTFALKHMASDHVAKLIAPYVYTDRFEAPGGVEIGQAPGAITVRETPDNLAKIARVLEELDIVNVSSYSLHFQVLAANGAETVDPRLADVVAELRKVFRFDGYALHGEGYISAVAGADFELVIDYGGWPSEGGTHYRLEGTVGFRGQLDVEVKAYRDGHSAELDTRFGFRPGQTVVLGTMPVAGETVFIAVNVEELGPSGSG